MFTFNALNAQLGIRVGGNMSDAIGESGNLSLQADPNFGFNGGLTYGFGEKKLQFRTGVLFNQKGYSNPWGFLDMNIRFNYIELPLHATYRLDFSENFGLQFHSGVYAGFLAFGSTKVDGEKQKIEFNNNTGLNRLDGGIDVGAAVNINKFQVGVNYSFGLLDIAKNDNSRITNNVLSLNLTYFPFK